MDIVNLISDNWQIVTIGILIVDKIVALSPSKMDDLLWASVKKALIGLKSLKKGRK